MKHFYIESGSYRLRMHTAAGEFDTKVGDGLAYIYRLAKVWCVGRGLDVGAAFFGEHYAGYPGATPVDTSIAGSGSAEDLSRYSGLDFIFCSHTLEHVADPEKAASEAFRALASGGSWFLYLPFPGSDPRSGGQQPQWDPELWPNARMHHLWQPDPSSVARLMVMAGFQVEHIEHGPDRLWSFVVVGRKP